MNKFTCSYRCSCGNRMEWEGSYKTICVEDELETMEIRGNGKCFRVILGNSEAGDFLCIPEHHAGLYTEGISDISLEEHLREHLEEKDARTIVTALAHRRQKKN